MNPDDIYKKVKSLQSDKKLSNRKLCEEAGVSHSVMDNWKKRKTIPSVPILEGLCSVLGISISQLFAHDNLEDFTEEEKILLELWSTLRLEDKKIILNSIKNMRSKY